MLKFSKKKCIKCWLSLLSHVQLFATPWTVAHQVPLSWLIHQARKLVCITVSSSRGSSQPRDQTWGHAAPALQADSLLLSHWGSPMCKMCERPIPIKRDGGSLTFLGQNDDSVWSQRMVFTTASFFRCTYCCLSESPSPVAILSWLHVGPVRWPVRREERLWTGEVGRALQSFCWRGF